MNVLKMGWGTLRCTCGRQCCTW